MAKVIHKNFTTESGSRVCRVTLDDGRTGEFRDNSMIKHRPDNEILSRAIDDAHKKSPPSRR
jgi:hypothetical protein